MTPPLSFRHGISAQFCLIILSLVCIVQQEQVGILIFKMMIFLPQILYMKINSIFKNTPYNCDFILVFNFFVWLLPNSKALGFVLQNPCSLSWKPVATLCFFVLVLCCFEPLSLIFKY